MEYENYFKEAFQKLNLLEQDFDITADVGKVDELKSFVADDKEAVIEEPVYDVKAENEEELEDEYIGKVILECECCHSKFYKDPDEVVIDPETSLANVEEECPLCNSSSGYTVIGKIEPFTMEEPTEEEVEMEVEDDVVDDVVEEPEEEEVEESLQDRIRRRNLTEKKENVCPHCGKEPCECEKVEEGKDCEDCEEPLEECGDKLTEGIENLVLDTEDQHLEMQADDSGKVTVTAEPLVENEEPAEAPAEEGEDEVVLDTDVEEIVPLDQEDVSEIEANSEEEQAEEEEQPEEEVPAEEPVEGEEEPEEDEEDLEFDEFDEESFDEMGESYLRKVYDNVKSYKTTNLTESNNVLAVKGVITFDSGNTKETSFVFTEARHLKNGKIILEGYNNSVSKTKKAFSLKGDIENKKFISESLGYHYITKNLNESVKVSGRVKKILV